MNITSKDEILKISEVAQLLKVSELTVRRWCKAGKLPAVKLGKHYRIRLQDINKIFEDKKISMKDEYEANNNSVS